MVVGFGCATSTMPPLGNGSAFFEGLASASPGATISSSGGRDTAAGAGRSAGSSGSTGAGPGLGSWAVAGSASQNASKVATIVFMIQHPPIVQPGSEQGSAWRQ